MYWYNSQGLFSLSENNEDEKYRETKQQKRDCLISINDASPYEKKNLHVI